MKKTTVLTVLAAVLLGALFLAWFFLYAPEPTYPSLDLPYTADIISAKSTYIYVNGMNTGFDKAVAQRDTLERVLTEAGIVGQDNSVLIRLVHNDSKGLRRDFLKSRSQARRIIAGEDGVEAEAEDLARAIQTQLREERNVVVVAFSQGALILQEALTRLPVPAEPPCLGVIALGAPVRHMSTSGFDRRKLMVVRGIYVSGDFARPLSEAVFNAGENTVFAEVSTTTARAIQSDWTISPFSRSKLLHSFQHGYMRDQARRRLKRYAIYIHNALAERCGR